MFSEIVFVGDTVQTHQDANVFSKDLEKLSSDYYCAVVTSLRSLCNRFTCYNKPEDFLDNIAKHKNAVVLSLWSGESSRNRRSLLPSICEAYNLPYVGADSYVQAICADKRLCKLLCMQHGINCARDVSITSPADFTKLTQIHYPAVVKPNYEGGSIGIFASNLVDSKQEAERICTNLIKEFPSLLVEEYIPGYEISICIAGTAKQIDIMETVQVSVDGNDYFEHSIMCAEAKKMGQHKTKREVVDHLLSALDVDRCKNLFSALGKVGVMRIDGRVNKNGFYLIELTPDCSLSPKGSVSVAFNAAGYTYDEMLEYLCANAITHHQAVNQSANR